MKKRILMIIFTALLISGFSDLYIDHAKASVITDQTMTDPSVTPTPELTPPPELTPTPEPTPTPIVPEANLISITQLPSKLIYEKGESLDLTNLSVQAFYVDGTTNFISDYQIVGYNADQIGPQTIIVIYQNQITYFQITVLPTKVANLRVSYYDTSSFTLSWDLDPYAVRYEIYYLNDMTGTYDYYTTTYTNTATFYYPMGSSESYMVCSVENILGIEYKSAMSEAVIAATAPDTVSGLVVIGTATSSITLSWNPAAGATGYLIYRSAATEDNYVLCGTTDALTTTFKSSRLMSGKSYKFKVYAYSTREEFVGGVSNISDSSTNPAKMALKYKQGDQKVRFAWSKINGATSYDIYISDQLGGYQLLTSFTGNTAVNYIAEGLTTGSIYSFYAVAHREYNGLRYDSPTSDLLTIEIKPIAPTSSTAKLFATDQDFKNSWVYNNLPFVKKYTSLAKSVAIPGQITTNVGGFTSNTMCPQGLTFAGNYLLMSAYDLAAVENSVIYVMDKTTKELLTTLVLPGKPHAGGLAFDGYNIWVTNGSRVSAIAYSEIDAAAVARLPYSKVNYLAAIPLNMTTSYITFYDGKLWIGTYNELQTTNLYSFRIDNVDTIPLLTQVDTMVMPTRVQGISFSSKGTLFLSRSCQMYKGLRGYIRQIDVYKPLYTQAVNGIIPLGNLVNSVNMPSMNEGIAIDGDYLYVNFEATAFAESTYRVDRILAFKMTNIVKKKG